MGPCEQEGGSERRVCVRARTGRREAVPLAQDTQPRGNGSEGIIKSGKKGWELRGGAWRGGFTRPGSYYTGLGASFPRPLPPSPKWAARSTWETPTPRASGPSELLQPCSQEVGVGALPAPPSRVPHPWGPLLPGVSRTAAQKGCTYPTHVAGLGLPLTSHPGGRCDAIDWEALIGHRGLSQLEA